MAIPKKMKNWVKKFDNRYFININNMPGNQDIIDVLGINYIDLENMRANRVNRRLNHQIMNRLWDRTDVNLNYTDESALMLAANNGYTSIVNALMHAGVVDNIADNTGEIVATQAVDDVQQNTQDTSFVERLMRERDSFSDRNL